MEPPRGGFMSPDIRARQVSCTAVSTAIHGFSRDVGRMAVRTCFRCGLAHVPAASSIHPRPGLKKKRIGGFALLRAYIGPEVYGLCGDREAN